jgi:alcohol dehydrogenase (cytochrome c)
MAGGEFGVPRIHRRVRRPNRQADLALQYDSPQRRARQRDLGRRSAGRTGSATTWVTGAYDPETNLVYWGTGNPGPDWNRRPTQGRQSLRRLRGRARCRLPGSRSGTSSTRPHDVTTGDSTQTPSLVEHDRAGPAAQDDRTCQIATDFYYFARSHQRKFMRGRP